MRTTLTLDDDVAAKLRAEARKSGEPFKLVVNRVLRIGLLSRERAKSVPPFKIEPRPLGLRPGLSYDNIEDLLDQIEGPLHR